jgi:hypothetical protein
MISRFLERRNREMFAYVFFRGDSESVLMPLFWLTLIVVITVTVLGAILGAIWLWARWHWIVKPKVEHPLHQLNEAEIRMLEQALNEAATEDEALRLRVILLSAQGYGIHQIVHLTGADRNDLEGWLALYEEMGIEMLRDKHPGAELSTPSSSLPSNMALI